MPQLLSRSLSVLSVRRISLQYLRLELGAVPERREVDGFQSGEDGRLLGEVAIVGVVQRVFNEVTNEHLHAARGLVLSLKIIGRDAFVFDMFYVGYVGEGDIVVVVDSIF